MRNIKQFCRLCHLWLLRHRLRYATDVVHRCSRHFAAFYHTTLARAFWQLSLWECQYREEAQRYLNADKRKEH